MTNEELVPARMVEAQKTLKERAEHELKKVLADAVFELPLTDTEKMALSWAASGKHIETLYDEYRPGEPPHYSVPKDTPVGVRVRVAELKTATISLERFKFVEMFHLTRYEDLTTGEFVELPSQDTYKNPRYKYKGWGYGTGYNYRITDAGLNKLKTVQAYGYKCCDACVKLFCVCSERTYCAEHGGGCHGSHD